MVNSFRSFAIVLPIGDSVTARVSTLSDLMRPYLTRPLKSQEHSYPFSLLQRTTLSGHYLSHSKAITTPIHIH